MLHWHVRKNQSGFTLIEILATVIIIGILAAISAPNFMALFNRNRSNNAMREVEGGLAEAQKQAIRRGRSCNVNITTTPGNSALVNPANGCLLSNRILDNNVSLSTSAPGAITFTGKGSIAGTPILFVTSIVNGSLDQQRCVVIENALGRMRTGRYIQDLANPLNSNLCQ